MIDFEEGNQPNKLFNLYRVTTFQETIYHYEDQLLNLIRRQDYAQAEILLMDFCLLPHPFNEVEDIFVLHLFFTSFITHLLSIQKERGPLPIRACKASYELLAEVNRWKSSTEYTVHISYYIEQIAQSICIDHLFYKGNPLIEAALCIIDEHLKNKQLSVTFIAKQLQVSPSHIQHLFKRHLQTSPSHYIARKKINAMILEIKESNESLHSIRKRFGFDNHSHFIQFFKKHTELTPLQFLRTQV